METAEPKSSLKINRAYVCPVEATVDLIGGKWKVIILFHLLTHGTLRFNQIKRMSPGVTQKMLTSQLRALEEDGFINRKIYPVVPPRVEYSLTPLGHSLKPIILTMKRWGSRHVLRDTA